MPEGRQDFNIFEDTQPTQAPSDPLASTGYDIFSEGVDPQPSMTKGTKLPSKPPSESNTLFGDATAQTFLGEIGAGIQSGTRQVLSTAPGLAAMATRSFDITQAQQLMEMSNQIAEGGAKRGIGKLEDLTWDPMTWARYAAGTLGESVPFVLSVIGGGAGSRLLSGLALRNGAPLATRKLLESTAPEAFGAFTTAAAIETAATLQELHKATGEIQSGPALVAGSIKGGLEAAFPLILSKQLGLNVGQAGGLYDRLLTQAATASKTRLGRLGTAMGVEGGTELAQEEVDIITRNFLDENYAYLGPEANSRRINSLVGGAIAGGGFSQIPGFHVDEALSDQAVRNAALDAPILYGAGYDEMPSTGPEDMVRNAHEGLDGTAGLAVGTLNDQLLGEVDLRKRGLFAAVVPGRDTTFGSQDQANNDHGYYGGSGFVRLDPSKVTRGDITASVEDIPATVADPRVEFRDQANAKSASDALVETIKLTTAARKTQRVAQREVLLTQAAVKYREAVNLGARVEPLVDGQVILRDETQVGRLAAAQEESAIRPQVTNATSFETRTRPGGGQMLVFKTGPSKNRKRPGGLSLDLENVNPDHVTALPSPELARSVLASQAVGQRLSVPAAKGKGIRFVEGTPNQPMLLGQLVKVLTALSSGKSFAANKGPIVERYMALVDAGLRIDVTAETKEFALLRKATRRELQDPTREIVGQELEGDDETQRLVKSRAKRKREPSVSRKIAFSDNKVELLYYTQLRASYFTEVVTGALEGGQGTGKAYSQKGNSPLVEMLRDLVKSMQLKTDFSIMIVEPGGAGTSGVKYENTDVQLTPGGKPQKRTVISIDPWHFSDPTQGKKPLTAPKQKISYVVQGDRAYQVAKLTKKTQDLMVEVEGKMTKFSDWYAQQQLPAGATHVLMEFTGANGLAVPLELGTEQQFQQQMDDRGAVTTADVNSKETKDYLSGATDIPPPAANGRTPNTAARYAKQMGVPDTKRFSTDEQITRFWAEFQYNMGKVLIDFEWGNLSQGEKDLIQTAWRRETFIARSLSRSNAIARVVSHPLLEAALGGRGRKEQFYQFEEWLTQNIARALSDPDTKIGVLEEFLRAAGRRIANVLNRIRKLASDTTGINYLDPRKGKAADTVQQWVERMYERGRTQREECFLQETTIKSLMDSINQNQKDLGGMNLEYAVATPQRASSVQIRKLLEILPENAHEDRAKLQGLIAWCDHINTTLEWGLGIHQMAEMNPHIPQLQEYVSNVRAMENEAVSWATMADNRLREINKLGRVQAGYLWHLMADLDALVYQDQKKLKEGKEKPRWPTGDELLALVRRHGLNKQAFDVYQKVRQDYLSFLSYLEMVGIRNAEEYVADPAIQAEKIKEIQGDIAQMRGRPYFPHMRFGLNAVTIKNNRGETVHFSTYETKKAREVAIRQLQMQFKVPQENRIIEDEISPALQHYQGLPGFALQNVKEALGLTGDSLTEQQKRDSDLLDSMALDAAPITSFRQNLRERSNTPGFSMDGARSYANYFARSAKFVARMAYTNKLQQTIKDIRKSASPVSKDTRTRIADYVQKHYDNEMNPAGDWAALRSMAFSWYFAFVPAAAAINLTQLPLVTWPYLSGKFGDLKGSLSLGKALEQNITDFWSRFRGKAVEDTPKQEAIDQAHDDRLIDDGFAVELAAIANGSVLSRTVTGSKTAKAIRHIAQWGAAPFSIAERTNRSITFRAAYDLAVANPDHPFVREVMFKNKAEADRLRIDRGWTEGQIAAYLTGATAVRDTQFEYARWARPKLMAGGRGVLLMFKTYMQNMLWFMFKSNRGVQARYLLTMLAAAGVMGLPGMDDAEELAKFIGKQLGYDLNPKNEIRAWLKDFTDSPDVFLHGASRVGFGIPAIMHGLGIPMATPDLSGSLSMGKLIPGLSAGLNPNSTRFNEMIGDVTQDLLGPALGVPLSMYQALTDMSLPADDPKRWERALPRALKSAVRSSRYLAEQRERDRTGGTVVQFDPNDWSDQMDAASVSLGLNPAKVSRQWDYIQASKEAQNYWRTRRQVLMSEYARARRLKDREAAQDAIGEIKAFNKDLPVKGLRITSDQIRESLSARGQAQKLKENQLPPQKYLRPLAKEVQGLFPEAQSPKERKTIREDRVR